jgi:hypothetical protein
MNLPNPGLLLVIGAVAILSAYGAQRASAPPPQQVAPAGPGSGQPTPDGFVPGSKWEFTTWTLPARAWLVQVERVSGGWAYLRVEGNGQPPEPAWYNVPQMPGRWRKL